MVFGLRACGTLSSAQAHQGVLLATRFTTCMKPLSAGLVLSLDRNVSDEVLSQVRTS